MTSAFQAEAIIDLDVYRANLTAISELVGDAELMAVVKADAYGHGMVPCAQAAREAGVSWLGVATIDEALALRASGDTGRILCWLHAPGADFGSAIDADIEVTASSADQLADIVVAAGSLPARVQLKVDTGLSRNGADGDQWPALVAAAAATPDSIDITGVWSHFACADQPEHPANDAQQAAFESALAVAAEAGLAPRWRHLANSAAALVRPGARYDLVRVGIAGYGIKPDPQLSMPIELTPVMTVQARLAAVKRVAAGESVSYGHTWTADSETTLGLVPLGYAEGILRTASSRAEVGFAGRRVPQRGVICMDQFVIDLGDQFAQRGDVVTLFGSGASGEPLAEDWAAAAGTIAYEVVTRLGGRVVRRYRGAR